MVTDNLQIVQKLTRYPLVSEPLKVADACQVMSYHHLLNRKHFNNIKLFRVDINVLKMLIKLTGDTINLSGIDIVDGTPVLDIKPYIACYDQPSQEPVKEVVPGAMSGLGILENNDSNLQMRPSTSSESKQEPDTQKINSDFCDMSTAEITRSETSTWIQKPPIKQLDVRFTPSAEAQLYQFSASAKDLNYRLKYLADTISLKQAITDILKADPRSTYRRKHCDDKLYFFVIDRVHVTCWFDDSHVEVLRLKSVGDTECSNFNDTSCYKQI